GSCMDAERSSTSNTSAGLASCMKCCSPQFGSSASPAVVVDVRSTIPASKMGEPVVDVAPVLVLVLWAVPVVVVEAGLRSMVVALSPPLLAEQAAATLRAASR